jgi:shikimate kinase/3-dehydroquinate synthase
VSDGGAVVKLDAQIGPSRFPVLAGSGLLDRIGDVWPPHATGAALVVHDAAVAGVAQKVAGAIGGRGLRVVSVAVPPGEPSKQLGELERLARFAASEGIRRSDTVVAVGGGVVGDLAGFLAASYQRGVRLVHVPTTLLAMVDSAIGGKTGVDLPEGKNYVGAIWQPDLVVMDVDVLDTLPPRELAAGFAEVVKYGLLEGGALLDDVDAWPELPGPRADLVELIVRCVRHKLRVVAEDERDVGVRGSLNLGHTVGHGIEAAAGYDRYLHGEAISLGMLAALRISEHHLGLASGWRERTSALLGRHGLPTRLDSSVATSAILAAMGRDKKADATALNMVLIDAPGVVRLRQDPDPAVVTAAIDELRDAGSDG